MASFTNFVMEFEMQIRLSAFFGMLVGMAAWEWAAPKLPQVLPRVRRWPANLGIVVLNTVLVRMLFPVLPVGVAAVAEARGWGLFALADLPVWMPFLASLLVLDLAIYAQHVMFHKVPWLWRLHRMHHADTAFDVTTGARFHPIEILLSIVIKMAVVVAIGAPPAAVVVFEVVLNATAMFNHANLRLPVGVDQVLRLFVVTPDMHRVHHSIVRRETDSNYGFNVPWWDRLFGTYIAQPDAGHDGMVIGLEKFRTPLDQRLDKMLLQPLR
jgi:sterol desaturase/sphingolipid hydroxylase (fatty acid hydroxylase superfamily)